MAVSLTARTEREPSSISLLTISRGRGSALEVAGHFWQADGTLSARYWSEASKERVDPQSVFYFWNGERPLDPNAPQLEGTGEIKLEGPDRAGGDLSGDVLVPAPEIDETDPGIDPLGHLGRLEACRGAAAVSRRRHGVCRQRGRDAATTSTGHGADHVDPTVARVVEGHQHRHVLVVDPGDVEVGRARVQRRHQPVEPIDSPELLEARLDDFERREVEGGGVDGFQGVSLTGGILGGATGL